MGGFQFLQHFEPVGIGQTEIEEHQIRFQFRHLPPSLRRVRRDLYGKPLALQDGGQRRLHVALVVNDHDRRHPVIQRCIHSPTANARRGVLESSKTKAARPLSGPCR